MEGTLKKILEELQSLNNRVGGLEDGMNSLSNRVGGLEDGMNSLNNRVGGLEQEQQLGFEGINKKLDIIATQVVHNTEQLNEVIFKVKEHDTDIKLKKSHKSIRTI